MKHLFSSGEILYKDNIKKLEEGEVVAESIYYTTVEASTEYIAEGTINGKAVEVFFKVSEEDFTQLQYKNMVRILMQSDIFTSNWIEYRIEYI